MYIYVYVRQPKGVLQVNNSPILERKSNMHNSVSDLSSSVAYSLYSSSLRDV